MESRRAPFSSLLVALAFAALSAGCDSMPGMTSRAKANAPNDAANAPPAGQTTTTSAAAPLGSGGQSPAVFTAGLSVSDVIAQACGISPSKSGRSLTPSFEFDSAALGDADRQMLAELAKCMTEGALRGKNVSLIGRADARGEAEYNMTLGESRADAVQRYLVDLGIGRGRSLPTSRGEMDATGTNDEGWAKDRRVDIELAL